MDILGVFKNYEIILHYVHGLFNSPINGGKTTRFKNFVTPGKMLTAEETAVGRKGTWMNGYKFLVDGVGDYLRFFPRVGAPKQKYHGGLLFVKFTDNTVGKVFPSPALMTVCLSAADGENGVKQ